MKKTVVVILLLAVVLFVIGCDQRIPDYAKDPTYENLFTDDDKKEENEGICQIKSFVILHTELFNREEFEKYSDHYYALDDSEKAEQADSLSKTAQTVKTEREIVYLSAVFLETDPNRAQIGAVVHTTVRELNGEILADYTDRITYDLYRDNGTWTIEREKTENVGYYS